MLLAGTGNFGPDIKVNVGELHLQGHEKLERLRNPISCELRMIANASRSVRKLIILFVNLANGLLKLSRRTNAKVGPHGQGLWQTE